MTEERKRMLRERLEGVRRELREGENQDGPAARPQSGYGAFVEELRDRCDDGFRRALEREAERRASGRRKRRRRRRDDSEDYDVSSDDTLSTGEDPDEIEARVFQQAGSLPAGLAGLSRRVPVALTRQTITRMRSYLEMRRHEVSPGSECSALATVFLKTILMPSAHPPFAQRRVREMHTLAFAIDMVLRGSPSMACDALCQKMKSLEQSHAEGDWEGAELSEVVPGHEVSMRSTHERALVSTLARRQRRSQSSRSPPRRRAE
jgi:hypothetical protein